MKSIVFALTRSIAISAVAFATTFGFASTSLSLMRDMDANNDPSQFFGRTTYETNLDALPQSGTIPYKLWSDTYWPNRLGGAAWRWQASQAPGAHPESDPRNYRLYQPWEIRVMTPAQIAELSPAEKYDIATGRYDYPTVHKEVARTNPNDPKWHGLCHAVAAVTSQYYEPQNQTVMATLPDGLQISVPFYSSDIKALLALSANEVVAHTSQGIGQPCRAEHPESAACWDTNPGAFYIAVTNMIGIMQKPLLLDVDPGPEVWNAVIKSYSAKISEMNEISPEASAATTRQVRVDMTLQHTLGAKPARAPVGARFKTETYAFTLELDASGAIVGGEWISKNRPDSLWKPEDHMPMDPGLLYLRRLTTPLN